MRDLEFEDEGEFESGDAAARLLIVSNRLPVTVETDTDGTVTWRKSSGGLVEALSGTQVRIAPTPPKLHSARTHRRPNAQPVTPPPAAS